MGYIEEQQKFFEQKQNNETINKIQNTNAKKEKEAQKRHKKLIFTKAKWLLYDEILKNSKDLTDFNMLLYDEKLKNKIIDNIFVELSKLYANFKDETNEDLNYYLLEIYNTQATKIINIKNKEKKELERIEKEKQKEEEEKKYKEYQEKLIKDYQEKLKIQNKIKLKKKQEQQIFDIFFAIFFVIIIFIIILSICL